MDITWYGQSCFKVKGKSASAVFDPFDPAVVGLKLPKLAADVVLVTHQHPDHNFVAGVAEGNPILIEGPGEYEVKGITVSGVSVFHDEVEGKERGKNTIYQCMIDGISIVHCGDLGHTLSKEQIEAIGVCHILMIPVGGVYTIDAAAAAEVVNQLEPLIILPMHYKIEGLKFDLEPVDKFLKEIGKEEKELQPKLTITKDKLPDEVQVVVLQKQ